jgi:transposase InsO family protein
LSGDTERQATSGEVTGLKREMRDLKEVVADLILENRVLKKKRARGWRVRRMRYPASEKLEIIRIAEQSHQPIKRRPQQIGVSRPTFYRWYDLYRRFGEAALEDRRGGSGRVWNRIPDKVREQMLDMALDQANVVHRPRLLSDNGPCYISGQLADYLGDKGMTHTRGAPYHPQTQGKIERWHQTLKNRILLGNDFLPGDLDAQIDAFVGHYNHQRYHESLKNLTPADVYTGRGHTILLEREKIKRKTMKLRRLQHAQSAA